MADREPAPSTSNKTPSARPDPLPTGDGKPSPRVLTPSDWALMILLVLIVTGLIVSFVYSLQTANVAQFWSVFAVALAVAGAALIAGMLLGFLFGIPRKLQHDLPPSANPPADRGQPDSGDAGYQANTNLEQISDWLTKILVGVGLTQLSTLPTSLHNFATFTAPGLGNFPSSQVFAVTLLVYELVCGFLLAYLWTRLYLGGALNQADRDAARLTNIENKVSELQKQSAHDVDALSMAQSQLHPSPNAPLIPQEKLDASIKLASDTIRDQIYQQADRIMNDAKNGKDTLINLKRTIPIFRALIASDTDDDHHEYHGDLGLALDLQQPSNPVEAEAALTKAIDMRGRWQDAGYVAWEFFRAATRIKQDHNYLAEKPSDPEFVEKILTDLRAPGSDPGWAASITDDLVLGPWLNLNGIMPAQYTPTKGAGTK